MIDSEFAPVHRIGIPNPMFEGEINLYVIAGDPLTLVDTGIGTPAAWEALEQGLAAHGLAVESIKQVVLTHKHADHIGQAAEIRDRSGATVMIHEDDLEGVIDLDSRHAEFIPLVLERLRSFHTPEAEVQELARQMDSRVRVARQTEAEPLVDGQRLFVNGQPLEVIHTPGHTQGSICLRYGSWLFSGDHVLPNISPNIGAGEMRRSGMLERYLDSLDRIIKLAEEQLTVLPGHGQPFTRLAERAAELADHHRKREEKIVEILRAQGAPMTVYEIAGKLWRKLPGYHLTLGTSEVHSHLELSCATGRARQENGRFVAV